MKISGLKAISDDSQNLGDNCYLQINYDIKDGHAWSDHHCSIGQNDWSRYKDRNIISCGNIDYPHTVGEIAERIEAMVKRYNESKTSGDKLRDIRESKGISRAELARMTNIPLRTIEDWEYRKYPLKDIDRIKLLAQTLNVDINELI